MLLQSILDSSLLQNVVYVEDGSHLRYWMRPNAAQHQDMMIAFTESVFASYFKTLDRKRNTFDFTLSDQCDQPAELDYEHLDFMLEMVGGVFALCGNAAVKKQRIVKEALQIYVHVTRTVLSGFRERRLTTQNVSVHTSTPRTQEDVQKVLRRMLGHVSSAFSTVSQNEKPHLLADILKYYRQLAVHYGHCLSEKSWNQLVALLMGITQHIVKECVSVP